MGVDTAIWILALIATVTVVSAVARRFELPAPLLLVVIGIGGSFLPFIEPFELSPELVLIGLLPPLLYSAAIKTSLVDVKANRRAIAWLAVGLVIATTALVGLVAYWLLPIPLAAGIRLRRRRRTPGRGCRHRHRPADRAAATHCHRPGGRITAERRHRAGRPAHRDRGRRPAPSASAASRVDFLWAAAGGAAIGVGGGHAVSR